MQRIGEEDEMSVLVEQHVPFDPLLQSTFKNQELFEQRVSLLWQRMVLLQKSEFLRQCSKTTGYGVMFLPFDIRVVLVSYASFGDALK